MESAVKEFLQGEYQKLGALAGRDARRRTWLTWPLGAAQVLVEESIAETNVERLAEVSSLLASLDEQGAAEALKGLAFQAARPEFYETMFLALRWTAWPLRDREIAELGSQIRRFTHSEDPAIRQAALEATSKLPRDLARALLLDARLEERDSEVLLTIQELLAEDE